MSVGLDIGSKTIKMVELSPDGKGMKLQAAGVLGYKGADIEKLEDEKDFVAVAEVVRKLHKEAKISSKEVVLSLPEHLVFTQTIKFPPLTDAEIASAVKWEAEQIIPIPVAEAIIQHQILERREKASPPVVIVLLVAAPRSLVEKYAKIVHLGRLTPVAVETDLVALVRALAPPDKTVLIVDFGAKSTDLAIAKNGLLSFSRSIPTAGEAFTRAVAQALDVEPAQAEEYKKTYGLSEEKLEGKVKSSLSSVFKVVTDEIKKAIHYYQTEEQGDAPKSLILSGGTSGMPDALSELTNLLEMEVEIGNPFKNITVDPGMEKSLAGYAPLYSVAVGLALRGK
ncbi:type IV pilus assembly protein PilM [Patescibacteria group bacterium]|nr:type IV pilus assembly protein PilM [Patescibacteria group bacterium]